MKEASGCSTDPLSVVKVGSEKKGKGVWKNHLNEVDEFEAEYMMGEIESVHVSEVMVPAEKLKEMIALAALGMSMSVSMGINRAKEPSGE